MHIEKVKTETENQSVIVSDSGRDKPTSKAVEYYLRFKDVGKVDQFVLDLQMGASIGAAIQKIGVSYDTLKKWLGYQGEEFDTLRTKMNQAIADCSVIAEQTMAMKSPHAWLTQGPGKYVQGNPWVDDGLGHAGDAGGKSGDTPGVAATLEDKNAPSQDDMMKALQEARKLGIDLNDLVDGGVQSITIQSNESDPLHLTSQSNEDITNQSSGGGGGGDRVDPPSTIGTPTNGGSNTKPFQGDRVGLTEDGTPNSSGSNSTPTYNTVKDNPMDILIKSYYKDVEISPDEIAQITQPTQTVYVDSEIGDNGTTIGVDVPEGIKDNTPISPFQKKLFRKSIEQCVRKASGGKLKRNKK